MYKLGKRNRWSVVVAQRAIKAFIADDMITYAAAVAFYTLVATVPFLILMLALISFFGITGFFDRLLTLSFLLLPSQIIGLLETIIRDLRAGEQSELVSVGIIASLWSASLGVRSLTKAVNVASKVTEVRHGWRNAVFSIVLTIALAVALVVIGSVLLASPRVLRWLTAWSGLDGFVLTLWSFLRFPLAAGLVMVAVAVIYHMAPNNRQSFKVLTPGGVVAMAGLGIASAGFSYYVSNINDYSATYGSLGTVVVTELYIYICAIVLLFGAEVNSVIANIINAKQ